MNKEMHLITLTAHQVQTRHPVLATSAHQAIEMAAELRWGAQATYYQRGNTEYIKLVGRRPFQVVTGGLSWIGDISLGVYSGEE